MKPRWKIRQIIFKEGSHHLLVFTVSVDNTFFDNCHRQEIGRHTLDLTQSVRYSNLPNNAKLELVKCEKSRAETPVIIALQLETGDRLQHEFHPSTSLWHILEHWEAKDDGYFVT